jgi:uncharacterized protein (DUF362 family)
MAASAIALTRCPDYDQSSVAQAVGRQFELLGGIERFVKPGDTVLLKPNFIAARSPEQDATQTHPAVILAVAKLLKDFGARPFVGDSPGWGDVRACAQALGLIEPLGKLGIPLRALDGPRATVVGPEGLRVALSTVALEADAIINLPKLKAHQQLLVTLAVKNLFGCVPGKRKALWHYRRGSDPMRFCEMLIGIARFLKPVMTIVDGIVAMERTGPTGGDDKALGWLIGGTDPIACEATCCRVIGVDPQRVPILRAARQMQLKGLDLDQIDLAGDPLPEAPESAFELPRLIPIRFSLARVIRSKCRQMLIQARRSLAG